MGVAIISRPVDPFTRRKATPKSLCPEGSLGSCCVAAFIGNFFEQLAGFSEHGVLISNDINQLNGKKRSLIIEWECLGGLTLQVTCKTCISDVLLIHHPNLARTDT